MSIRPIVDSKGNLIIRGAVVGSQAFDAEVAVILVLKLEQFESFQPVIDPPPDWEPLMRGADDLDPAPTVEAQAEPRESKPSVQMLQIAIPALEARKLGWTLTEMANQILDAPRSHPKH